MTPAAIDAALEILQRVAQEWLGFSETAVSPRSLARALQSAALYDAELAARVAEVEARSPESLQWLSSAITVGETYFFREPAHFDLVATLVRQRARSDDGSTYRAWSAGCSTGEEAYSLAACLQDALPPHRPIEVVGSDIVAARLEVARQGRYSRWSARSAMARRCLVEGNGVNVVTDDLRAITSFVVHNLLSPWPSPGTFDLVMCRNVLAYLGEQARAAVLSNLAAAVRPGGSLILGPLDVDHTPDGFTRTDVDGAALLVREPPALRQREQRPVSGGGTVRAPGPQELHHAALVAIEQRDEALAAQLLERAVHRYPTYLPAALELALLARRRGDLARCHALMTSLAEQTQTLSDADPLDGSDHVTVAFLRRTIEEFFLQEEGRS